MTDYTTTNPVTGQTERTFPHLEDSQVDQLLDRSTRAFSSWRTTSPEDRAAALARTAEAYARREDELARIIAVEMGKPLAEAAVEVQLAASIYQWYADHGPALLEPETLDLGDDAESVVQTEPVGPLVGVMPWNFPYYQVARFVAPNLMAGNTIILKHASICAASAEAMAEILHQAGVPEDAYINVFADNDQVATMIEDPRVRGVSLTGSERAGASVAETAAKSLKKAVLELGGSDPLIVLPDADLDAVAEQAATARLSNAGQACNSPKRMFVPEDRLEEFVQKVVAQFEAAVVGDPTDEATTMGPLSSVEARDGVHEQIQQAVQDGARLRTGGDVIGEEGAFLQPTVLTGVTEDMDAYRDEIFGPVAVIHGYGSVDEAVEMANDVDFGLSGSVWGTDLDTAREVADRLEVGMAYVNEHGTTRAGLPFGGVKRSGFGRELGRWGMGEFVNVRLRRTAAAGE